MPGVPVLTTVLCLQMPKVEFKSAGRPSLYAYPPPLEEKKNQTKEKVETAVLSITAKHRRKEAEKKKEEEKMDVVSCQLVWFILQLAALPWTSPS